LLTLGALEAMRETSGKGRRRQSVTFAALLLLAPVTLLLAPVALAYEVGPMRMVLVPSQGQKGSSISVNNTDKEPLRAEINVLRRTVAEDGTQTFTPADDDFTVFPLQMEIAPGKSQSVRFQYVGPPITTEAVGYVIQVAQVPVTPPDFSGVKFAYNFGVAVYLDPPRAAQRLALESVDRKGDKLDLVVTNTGNSYGVISTRKLVIDAGGKSITISATDLGARIPNPLVPPNGKRRIQIEIPELKSLPPGPVTARLLDGVD
jgi:fimbrial chaperone protein